MKKILILNGSHSEIPLICEARGLGYYVITSGNNPHLPGHKYADEYRFGDYSNQEQMLQIAKECDIDAICSCANDFGAITAAYIAENLGLPGHDSYETAKLLHQKDKFKIFAGLHKLQTPTADIYSQVEEAIRGGALYTYPMIVKPVDLTGGKGVARVNNPQEFAAAVNVALGKSRQGKIVAEQFIEGTYHSFSTFLADQKAVAYFSDNEYPFINPYFVATSGGPATGVLKVRDKLIKQAEFVAKKLGLVNGVFHMQYVMDREDIPYIIDITRRCSGDMYPEPVEHATGIPWAKWIVMSEAGYPSSSYTKQGQQRGYCGRHCIMAEKNGRVKDVIISEELKNNIYKEVNWWNRGDLIQNYLTEKLGILFMEYESQQEMFSKISRIKELVHVVME